MTPKIIFSLHRIFCGKTVANMDGKQKRKANNQQPTATGGAAAHDKKKWEDTFTHDGNGRYAMQPWKPCHVFRRASGNLNYQDPQPFIRMSEALAAMQRIVQNFHAMLVYIEAQQVNKTHKGTIFGDKVLDAPPMPTELVIYGGWPDRTEQFDYQNEEVKDHSLGRALWFQEQLGDAIGMCAPLESLHLENMEWYYNDKNTSVKLFFVNVRHCEKLKKLAVVNNVNGDCFLKNIIPEVLKMKGLQQLDLTGNRLYRDAEYGDKDEEDARETAFVDLLATLGQCETLVSLKLADMNLKITPAPDDMTTRMIISLMQQLPLLDTLDLSGNELDGETMSPICFVAPSKLKIVFDLD